MILQTVKAHIENEPINSVLVLLKENPGLSKEEIASGIGKSRSTVTRILASLIRENRIRRTGSDKKGRWEIL